MGTSHIAALRRVLAPPPGPAAMVPAAAPEAARCELCALPLGERHEHLLELASRQIACACTGCALLFDSGRGAWRRLPRDSRYLPGFELSGVEWAGLEIPIQLAFLWRNSITGGVTAAYPSPAGAVVAEVAGEAWAAIVGHHPELETMAPDLEALLLNRMETPHQAFIIPLDRGYRLTGLIRAAWSGFSGGPGARRALADFCAELKAEARVEGHHAATPA